MYPRLLSSKLRPWPYSQRLECGQYLLGRLGDAPGLRGGEVVREETADRGVAGLATGLGGADAVGDDRCRSLEGQQVAVGYTDADGILVLFLATGGAVLARGQAQVPPQVQGGSP